MGGLLPNWASFRDPMNAVHTPAQLAPAWCYVAASTGIAVDEGLWREDPPSSSYPACLAVKAALQQGPGAEERYLRAARSAALTRRPNIARGAVLLQLADELASDSPFDVDRFANDLQSPAVAAAFADDLRECRAQQIGRFPTFIVTGPRCSRLVVGYRPYDLFFAGAGGRRAALRHPRWRAERYRRHIRGR